jgi:hypothetical protein
MIYFYDTKVGLKFLYNDQTSELYMDIICFMNTFYIDPMVLSYHKYDIEIFSHTIFIPLSLCKKLVNERIDNDFIKSDMKIFERFEKLALLFLEESKKETEDIEKKYVDRNRDKTEQVQA